MKAFELRGPGGRTWRATLCSPTAIALALKLAGAVASFLITFLLARYFGATVSGEYGMAVQTAATISAFLIVGLDQITVRTIGGDLREQRPDKAVAALYEAARFVAVTSVVGAVGLLILSPFGSWISTPPQVLALSALALLTFPLLRLAVSGLRATGRVVLSQVVDGPVQSGTLAIAIILGIVLERQLRTEQILIFYAASQAFTCAIGWMLLYSKTRHWPRSPERQYRSIATVGWTVVLATSTHALTSWFLMAQVGAYAGAAEVGAFRVAIQIITIIAMLITTIESIINPQYAGDFRIGRYDLARRRHRRGTLMLMVVAGPPILICLIFPRQLLELFGPDFIVAKSALQIMVFAQLINLVTGPLGNMLLMSGRDRLPLFFAMVGLIVSVALAFWLTPIWGVTGAAIGYAGGLIFRMVASYITIFFIVPEMRRPDIATAGRQQQP